MLDQHRLTVALTPEEACRALRRWPINGDAGPVGMVQRIGRGPGVVIGPWRHRQPLQVTDRDGTVLARVRRSRERMDHAATHTIHRADHTVLGTVRSSPPPVGGPATATHHLISTDGQELASLHPVADERPGTRRFGPAEVPGLDAIHLTISPPDGGWSIQQVWALTGFEGLTDPLRLLTLCLTLVVAPWRAAEQAAVTRRRSLHPDA